MAKLQNLSRVYKFDPLFLLIRNLLIMENKEPLILQREQEESKIGYDKWTYQALFTVLGAWGVLLVIGNQLAWGNDSTYVCSYFHHLGCDVSMKDFYIVQPNIVLVATVFYPIGTIMAENFGVKR